MKVGKILDKKCNLLSSSNVTSMIGATSRKVPGSNTNEVTYFYYIYLRVPPSQWPLDLKSAPGNIFGVKGLPAAGVEG
jgi:hypothetical protein